MYAGPHRKLSRSPSLSSIERRTRPSRSSQPASSSVFEPNEPEQRRTGSRAPSPVTSQVSSQVELRPEPNTYRLDPQAEVLIRASNKAKPSRVPNSEHNPESIRHSRPDLSRVESRAKPSQALSRSEPSRDELRPIARTSGRTSSRVRVEPNRAELPVKPSRIASHHPSNVSRSGRRAEPSRVELRAEPSRVEQIFESSRTEPRESSPESNQDGSSRASSQN